MHKFFVEENQINNSQIKIINDDYNHIINVLRMKKGDSLLITNKKTQETFNCIVTEITPNEVLCDIVNIENKNVEMNVNVDIFQGLPKADKMEYIIQKCVELGVHKLSLIHISEPTRP